MSRTFPGAAPAFGNEWGVAPTVLRFAVATAPSADLTGEDRDHSASVLIPWQPDRASSTSGGVAGRRQAGPWSPHRELSGMIGCLPGLNVRDASIGRS
ncbi:hypothetical protein [Amycolatopsis regifaucium]|uniref:Uncharacterized protein n=1 Tax=Amycolatopsis regifaucium TaxID=546365 RepID=A0A154MCB0_9PSEU|nr:hypothetical protein [Amycolatopsis regifaucium]KZB82195.1 hypothetical protein AVL48_09695 [Amycolatopsis regifaucium]